MTEKKMTLDKRTLLPLGLVVTLLAGVIGFTLAFATVRADVTTNTRELAKQGAEINHIKNDISDMKTSQTEILTILKYGNVLKPKPKKKASKTDG